MTQATENRKRRRSEPLYECLECSRKFYTTRAAEKATFGDEGCPGCGGVDIDVYAPEHFGQLVALELAGLPEAVP